MVVHYCDFCGKLISEKEIRHIDIIEDASKHFSFKNTEYECCEDCEKEIKKMLLTLIVKERPDDD